MFIFGGYEERVSYRYIHMHFFCFIFALMNTLLTFRLSSSGSKRNIGQRFVSSWHDLWQQSSCRSSLCLLPPDPLLACLAMFF